MVRNKTISKERLIELWENDTLEFYCCLCYDTLVKKQELQEEIDNLPAPDASITKKEKRHQQVLLLKKESLIRVQGARQRNNLQDEFANVAMYGLLESWGEKNPILMHIVKARMGININIF